MRQRRSDRRRRGPAQRAGAVPRLPALEVEGQEGRERAPGPAAPQFVASRGRLKWMSRGFAGGPCLAVGGGAEQEAAATAAATAVACRRGSSAPVWRAARRRRRVSSALQGCRQPGDTPLVQNAARNLGPPPAPPPPRIPLGGPPPVGLRASQSWAPTIVGDTSFWPSLCKIEAWVRRPIPKHESITCVRHYGQEPCSYDRAGLLPYL